jgi:hypothetical protein
VVGRLVGNLLWSGNSVQALEMQARVVQQNPLAPRERERLATILFYTGKYEAMREQLAVARRQLAMGTDVIAELLLHAAIIEGDQTAALDALAQLGPGLPRDHCVSLMAGSWVSEAAGMAATRRLIDSESVTADIMIAEAQAWSGDANAAFTSLDRARGRLGSATADLRVLRSVLQSRVSPFFAPLHGDARWKHWIDHLPDPVARAEPTKSRD